MGVDVVVFFFQAEDGIRDLTVTGVQTCALPISGVFSAPCCSRQTESALKVEVGELELVLVWTCRGDGEVDAARAGAHLRSELEQLRSEERRVGKECRSRAAPDHRERNVRTLHAV